MSLFCLLYPSVYLSDCYNPIQSLNDNLGIKDIQKQIRNRISAKLTEYPNKTTGNIDYRWYYLAPLLMDEEEYVNNWLNSGDKLADYGDDEEKSRRQKAFNTHLATLNELFTETIDEGCENLGKRPEDLVDVLTDMAIASPAICINRTYRMYLNEDEQLPSYMPSQLARVFLNRIIRLNLQQSLSWLAEENQMMFIGKTC